MPRESPSAKPRDPGAELASAAKQWRKATEDRLRFLDSRGEAMAAMLDPDRALCEALERYEQTA